MTRFAMSIDLDRCVGCQACMVACKAENEVPDPLFRLTVSEKAGTGAKALVTFAHAQCFHCEQPACVAICPAGATYKDANGVVRLDREKCINCGDCVAACPYAARHYDFAAGAVQKCDFCAQRLESHLLPACVDVCPTEARLFGDLDQLDTPFAKGASAKEARVFRPDLGLKPKLFFVAKSDKLTDLAMSALPERAVTPLLAGLWSGVTRPLSGFGTALAAAVTLLAFPLAWRNARMQKKDVVDVVNDAAAPVETDRQTAGGRGRQSGEAARPTLPAGALPGAAAGREKGTESGAAGQRPAVPVPGAGQKKGDGAGRRPAAVPGPGAGHKEGDGAGQRLAVPGPGPRASGPPPAQAPAKKRIAKKGGRHGQR
jgi:tetrathionate reductase subunit B